MNLFTRHIAGLADFKGRENRQPFWLWVLISYGIQMVFGMLVMIPLVVSMLDRMQGLQGYDPAYLNTHPEVMFKVMAPFFSSIMWVNLGFMLVFFVLLFAAIVRRLHDGERSAWWAAPYFLLQIAMLVGLGTVFPHFFETMGTMRPGMSPHEVNAAMGPMLQTVVGVWGVGLLSFVAMILLVVMLCLPGTPGPNKYGEDPLAAPPRGGFPS